MEMNGCLVTHIGEGKFQVKLESGEIKEAGPNLCGLIRYTYFEDYTLPEIGWKVTRKQLMEDYLPKIQQDVLSGKFPFSWLEEQ
jgi:hypothetical protein